MAVQRTRRTHCTVEFHKRFDEPNLVGSSADVPEGRVGEARYINRRIQPAHLASLRDVFARVGNPHEHLPVPGRPLRGPASTS